MPPLYAQYVGDRDPVEVLRSSLQEYRNVASRISADLWQRSWAPGKWTMREIMIHVAQWEQIFGQRLWFGVNVPGYVVQPADQDLLMRHVGAIDGPTAFAAFDGSRRFTLGFVESLTPEMRRQTFQHEERGPIDANDVLVTIAGHGMHHLAQMTKALE
jgi:uncharacterized damage-inducible protein DinB